MKLIPFTYRCFAKIHNLGNWHRARNPNRFGVAVDGEAWKPAARCRYGALKPPFPNKFGVIRKPQQIWGFRRQARFDGGAVRHPCRTLRAGVAGGTAGLQAVAGEDFGKGSRVRGCRLAGKKLQGRAVVVTPRRPGQLVAVTITERGCSCRCQRPVTLASPWTADGNALVSRALPAPA